MLSQLTYPLLLIVIHPDPFKLLLAWNHVRESLRNYINIQNHLCVLD